MCVSPMDQRGRPISPAVLSAAEEVRRRAIHYINYAIQKIKTLTDASPEKPNRLSNVRAS